MKFHQVMKTLFPLLDIAELEEAIVSTSVTLKIVQNVTVDALKNLQSEINSLLQLIIQNCWALEHLLALQGGMCVILNTTCFYAN